MGGYDTALTTQALSVNPNITSQCTQNEQGMGKTKTNEANVFLIIPSMAIFHRSSVPMHPVECIFLADINIPE